MLNCTHATELIPIQHEDVMKGQYKLPIGSHIVSVPRAASISSDSSMGGTGEVETTHTTCTPFFRKTRDSDIFLTTSYTLLLLNSSLVYVCNTCNPKDKGCTPAGCDSPAFKGVTITWALSSRGGLVLHSRIWV